jgi:hypothetical protein
MESGIQRVLIQTRELESEIQRAAFEVLQGEGDYERSQQLLLVASDVKKLGARLEEVITGKTKPARGVSQGPAEPGRSASRTRKASGRKYPVIYVSDGRIVKIGKGKQKTAKEYRHEAPRSSYDVVARWIEETSMTGSLEWMARTADEQLNDQVPTYQIYLIIAALQKAAVVHAVRRGWYALADNAGSPDEWWRRLEGLSRQATLGGDQ